MVGIGVLELVIIVGVIGVLIVVATAFVVGSDRRKDS
jgi:hypothetical protein